MSSIYPKAKHFAALIDNTRAKADSWMLKLLSFSGRIELIKSVLQNLLTYLAFSFKLLDSVVRELESMQSSSVVARCRAGARKIFVSLRKEAVVSRECQTLYTTGIRLVWRLYSSQSPWSSWMRKHYLKTKHIAQIYFFLV